MVKKPPHEPLNVEGHELLDHAALQTLFGKTARGDGPCCDQHAESSRPDPVDQGQDTGELSDACAVQPDKGAFRSSNAAFTAAFRQALTVFLAALEASRQKDGSERTGRRGQQPIHPQAGRQFTNQDTPLPVLSAIS